MSKTTVTVTVKLDQFQSMAKQMFSKTGTGQILGTEVIAMMKEFIAKGISPIRGGGKFIGYATQRNNDEKAYPRDSNTKKIAPDKQVRPVNLFLTGEMLNALKYKTLNDGVLIGYNEAKKEIQDRVISHNEGSSRVPQRKFLPTSPGDTFNITIMRKIKDIYINGIKSIIKGLLK